MTMQALTPDKARGQYTPYARRKTTATTGNYRRIHEALMGMADKDGVFQSTEALYAVMEKLGVNRASASSSIFQWSDPTGRRGFRKVRLYTPRAAASTPPEKPEEEGKAKDADWARRAFADMPKVNKDGPFYNGRGPGDGNRERTVLEQLLKFQATYEENDGFWQLREGVSEMAKLGFTPTSVYRILRDTVSNGGCARRGWGRRLDPNYVASLGAPEPEINEAPEQEPGGVSQEPVMGHRIEQEPERDNLHEQALRQKVEQLVMDTLARPETIRAIDKLVGDAIIASAKRQLGV